MDLNGNQKVKAPRQQVFNALLDPEVLKNCIQGCKGAEFVDMPGGRRLKLTISPGIPGLQGPYMVFLETGEVIPFSRVVLLAEPTSSLGSIKAACTVDMSDDAEGTLLNYNAHAEVEGKIASVPEMVRNGAIKMALNHFFKSFEKQLSATPA